MVVFGDQEQRVVTESSAASIILDHSAITSSFDDGVDLSLGIGKGGRADIVGFAIGVGKFRQFRQHLAVVRFVATLFASVAGGVNAGFAAKSGND